MSKDCVQNTEPGPGRQLGTLRSEDGDGSKNVAGKMNSRSFNLHRFVNCGALSIHPKILQILVGTSNETDHFGLVRPEYSGPALKVVHFDRSGHFGRSDRNVSFHLSKLLPQYRTFVSCLQEQVVSNGK